MANIFDDCQEALENFKDSLQALTVQSKVFVDEYKAYSLKTTRDADLLREKIINKVAEALNDEDS